MKPNGDQPLVTVAIPTYRRPDMLRQAIASALGQTYRNIEVLVSDSDADPAIAALVESFGDPRLRYRDNGAVSDMSHNIKALYQDARGEFIGTLHDDDLWEPDLLERLVPPLVTDDSLTLAFADYWVTDADGNVRPDLTDADARKRGRAELRPGMHRPFVHLAAADRAIAMYVGTLFRASAVDFSEWRHDLVAVHDMWLAYLLSRDGAGAWYEPRRLARLRAHPGAASSVDRLDEAAVTAFETFLADERLGDVRPDLLRAVAPHHVGLALTVLSDGKRSARRRAAPHLRAGLRGGLTPHTLVACALWCLPFPMRRRIIEESRRVRARRAGRAAAGTPA